MASAIPPAMDDVLRERFGFDGYRPGQREAIETLFETGRLVCIQPTGHGKSLLYQLPAAVLEGMTLVVSPLLALMRDQVGQLKTRFDMAAGSINSDQTEEENAAVMTAARKGQLRILFVAPERLDNLETFEFITSLPIDLFVVDEAHCISTWGHDFRPSYRQIMHAVHALQNVRPELRVLGLTATANARTETDILVQFRAEDGGESAIQRQTMDRPNISLRVIPTPGLDAKLVRLSQLLEEYGQAGKACGVLYCSTRENTEIIAGYLSSVGHNVVAYHAGLAPDLKRDLQARFTTGEQCVIAATNALGMGIDKPDIRFIVHVDVPGSITAYYQEVGRAGRDGDPATGILLYDERDREVQEYFIRSAQPTVEDFATVLSCMPKERRGAEDNAPARRQIGALTGMHPTKVTVVIAELVEQGFVVKRLAGRRQVYLQTDRQDRADLSRYERQHVVRTEELEAMLEYGRSSTSCSMQRLRLALGDTEATECGRCGSCQPGVAVEPIAESELAAARRWVTHRDIAIPATRAPKMEAGLSLLDGQVRSPQFVAFMQSRAEQDDLSDDLAEQFEAALLRLAETTTFTFAVMIPSRTWSQRAAIGRRIERVLGIRVFDDLLEWDPEPESRQGELLNNDQRRDNVHGKLTPAHTRLPQGAMLIVDDYLGSGVTLKEAIRALRKGANFKDDIVPLTIARVRWRLGSRGMI